VVHPSPTAVNTIKIPYRVGFDGLVALSGLASGGSGTTLVDSTFANVYPDDYFNGWFINTLDSTGKNGYAVVTDFTGTTCTFTVTDWLSNSDKSTAAAADPGDATSYFVTDGLKHPAGARFDKVIRSAIMVETSQEFGQLSFDAVGEYMQKDLPEAHAADARTKPRTSGKMRSGSPSIRSHGGQHRSRSDVTYD